MSPSILVVDDEPDFLESVERMLCMEGYGDVVTLCAPTEVLPLLSRRSFDLAFLDITMPTLDGLTLLGLVKEHSPETECVMLTADQDIRTVVTAIKRGAYDYLVKPVLPEQMLMVLTRALEHWRLREAMVLHDQPAAARALRAPAAFSELTTVNEPMLRLLRETELHAASDIPILITGETGCGKELLARAVHRASPRARGPFVPVNMLALTPSLFESEFFGHAKGAFTGADRDRPGYLAQARGGTLFLDEIGDLSLDIQGKLLRVLQENEYTPVGKSRAESADVRFVTATNQDLEKSVRLGRFRKDLFYRLRFARLHVPPLRDRLEDIPLLAQRFLPRGLRLSEESEVALLSHEWPGNVRELKGVIEAASNLAQSGAIQPGHLRLPEPRRQASLSALASARAEGTLPLEEVEKHHILAVYEATGRNKSKTARWLQIGLQTLHRKLKAYEAS